MPVKSAVAVWNGTLTDGSGTLKTQSGVVSAPYGWNSRAGDTPGTNPEELIAGAHAGCFSMALSHILTSAGHPPKSISTSAEVSFSQVGDGFAITGIVLKTQVVVPGLTDVQFQQHAAAAKTGCPVSKALASVPIDLHATLSA